MRYEDFQNRGASPRAGLWPLTTVFTVYQHEAVRVRSAHLSVTVWHLVNRVSLLIARLRDRAAHTYAYRRAASDLSRLTDHELKDIGITRSQIQSVVRYGRMQQPR
ncbi:MAG: DUF1127 domain-containing protein, partial [Gammaproteobacteria bacterium]